MKTDFTPHYPQEVYTATIKLNVTKEEISGLLYMLRQAEPSNVDEQKILNDVLNELRYAYDWITEMEDIRRQLKENK